MFRIFKIIDPFYRRFKRHRYWNLKELAEKQGLIKKDEENASSGEDEKTKSGSETEHSG